MSAMGFGRLEAAVGCRALGAAVDEAGAAFELRAAEGEDGSAFSLFVPWDDDGSVWSGASKGSEEGSGARKRGEGGLAG
jgi:hypothetical protein